MEVWECLFQNNLAFEIAIMENGNSLKRYCDESLFFEKLGIVIEE